MLVDVLNWKKEKIDTISLDPSVFSVEVREEVLHSIVTWQLAARRQGNHQVKTKGLVSGGGKKPFKQKGTGNARQGSTRSPLMPGGGTVFGPQKRGHSISLTKKMRRLGLSMALSFLHKQGRLFVVDGMLSDGKTAELFDRLSFFGLKKALLVDIGMNDLFKRSSRNLREFKYCSVEGINVYDLLKYNTLVVTRDSVAGILSRCEMGN